jgi:hypothetical protein
MIGKLSYTRAVIPHLKGWSKVWSGDALTLYPPAAEGGAQVGAIRYRERVRPLVRTSVIVEKLLARFPQFKVSEASRPEMLVTAEGEYAAHVLVTGTIDGKPAQRDVGLVFGDDFYAMISSLCLAPDRFEEFTRSVKLLVKMDAHALGTRRRRYLYTPPADWHGLTRGFTTEWSPLDFPKNLSLLHVFPANPLAEEPVRVLEQMLAEDVAGGFELEGQRGPEPIASVHGLTGSAWNVVGRFGDKPRSFRDLVVFRDARYLYALRLETMQEERAAERALFLDTVRSVQPIPMPSRAEPRELGSLVGHWVL